MFWTFEARKIAVDWSNTYIFLSYRSATILLLIIIGSYSNLIWRICICVCVWVNSYIESVRLDFIKCFYIACCFIYFLRVIFFLLFNEFFFPLLFICYWSGSIFAAVDTLELDEFCWRIYSSFVFYFRHDFSFRFWFLFTRNTRKQKVKSSHESKHKHVCFYICHLFHASVLCRLLNIISFFFFIVLLNCLNCIHFARC